MSFLRALPSLRPRVAYRAWTAAPFTSTASTSARPNNAAVTDIFSALTEGGSVPPEQTSTTEKEVLADDADPIVDSAPVDPIEDGPPLPSEDSYPRSANPAALANAARNRAEVGVTKPVYTVSVKATRNNTIVTFARPGGNQLVTLTGGKLGFKKSNRNGYEAGYQCAVGIIAAMEAEMQRTDFEWQLFLKGFGQGRDAMLTAITTAVGVKVKGRLQRVTDRTPLKIGGTRGQKTRRI